MNFDRIGSHGAEPSFDGASLTIPREALATLAAAAFDRLSFTFTEEHLEQLLRVATTETNSRQDRMVAGMLLENAAIASRGVLPICQDTGIANVFAWKGQAARTAGKDGQALSEGIADTYKNRKLRLSTTVPSSLFEESDPGDNMPAQVLIQADDSNPEGANGPAYRFLFCAKGGGSSNKTSLIQGTKALLNERAFIAHLEREIQKLGTAACPPYSIACVVGGLSPEQNLLALKLATAGYFDHELPGWDYRVLGSIPLRDQKMERKALEIAENTGLGAQFGGKALACSARVLRLPRHGASCPVSVGVSCSAHRNLHGYIDRDGIWLEQTVAAPLSIPGIAEAIAETKALSGQSLALHLTESMSENARRLSGLEPGASVTLTGKILVARDAAHARWSRLVAEGKPLPDYVARFPIFYAGPAQTPEGRVTGSIGPTTAGRMDDYAEELMSRGAALVTLAKGNRSAAWTLACKRYGATYLGTVGGAAALIAEKYIARSEIVDYADLGMEAVRLIEVRDLPAFVITNDRGADLYAAIGEKRK
ncbi:MAG TPA: FumA C-terminus/TtdB family hydratase beta subunit [Treponemataceae bacterium]|nr:FumA C-terminus/TtdB family hydratase beta subunit [Treponemataceae bacterium]